MCPPCVQSICMVVWATNELLYNFYITIANYYITIILLYNYNISKIVLKFKATFYMLCFTPTIKAVLPRCQEKCLSSDVILSWMLGLKFKYINSKLDQLIGDFLLNAKKRKALFMFSRTIKEFGKRIPIRCKALPFLTIRTPFCFCLTPGIRTRLVLEERAGFCWSRPFRQARMSPPRLFLLRTLCHGAPSDIHRVHPVSLW